MTRRPAENSDPFMPCAGHNPIQPGHFRQTLNDAAGGNHRHDRPALSSATYQICQQPETPRVDVVYAG
jgi:hypothetical protein